MIPARLTLGRAIGLVEGLLRHDDDLVRRSDHRIRTVLFATILCGAAVAGLFLGAFEWRWQQLLASAVKLPLLIVLVTLTVIPSIVVINLVFGLGDDMKAVLSAIFAAQATMAISLAALGPTTLMVYHSTDDYRFALQYNGVPFLVSALCAQVTLARHYRPLIAKNRLHLVPLVYWLIAYCGVAIQTAWILRPFIGDPEQPFEFLRDNAFTNAYVEILEDLVKLARGR